MISSLWWTDFVTNGLLRRNVGNNRQNRELYGWFGIHSGAEIILIHIKKIWIFDRQMISSLGLILSQMASYVVGRKHQNYSV